DNTEYLERFFDWLRAFLESFFETREMRGFAHGTRFLVLVLALVVLAFGLWRWVGRRSPAAARARRDRLSAPQDALLLDSPSEHLGRAQGLLATSPREAIREGLLALLSALERKRLAQPDRVKTNRELARELPLRGAPGPLSSEVRGLLEWYDAA